jgi:hypothetical protein
MHNVYLEKIASFLEVNPYLEKIADTQQRTSTEKTFAVSEGLGMAASLAGGLIGGRLGSRPLGKAMAATKFAQGMGRRLFGKDAVLTGTHLGSEIGAHTIGALGSYGAMKGVEAYDKRAKQPTV